LSSSEDDSDPARGSRSGLFGSELFSVLAQIRDFCDALRLLLRNLPNWFGTAEREFAAELASGIDRRILAPNELLGSRGQAIDLVRDMLVDSFGRLPPEDQAMVDRMVEHLCERGLGLGPELMAEAPKARFAVMTGNVRLLTEPGARWRPFALSLASGRRLEPSEAQRRTCRYLAELISDLDHTTSLPALLDKLRKLSNSDLVV
jgi:hypothetical protein